MNLALITWAAILALWTIASVAFYFYLQGVERVTRDRNTASHEIAKNLSNRKDELDNREADLKAEEKSCREQEVKLAAREAELAKKELELLQREDSLKAKKTKKAK